MLNQELGTTSTMGTPVRVEADVDEPLFARRFTGLSLRTKTMLLISGTISGLLILVLLPLQVFLRNSYLSMEEEFLNRNIARAKNEIESMMATLNSTASDYAAWNDTYQFVVAPDTQYPENFGDATMLNSRLNLVLLLDRSNRVIFSRAFDLQAAREVPVPELFDAAAFQRDNTLPQISASDTAIRFVMLPDGPMLIAAHAILPTNKNGASRGTLIMGRYLDEAQTKPISEAIRVPVSIHRVDGTQLPDDVATAHTQLSSGRDRFYQPLSNTILAGYVQLPDIYNRPGFVLRVAMNRDIYVQGQTSIRYFTASLLVASLVFGLVMLVLIERIVLSRLTWLNSNVSKVGASTTLSSRVPVQGNDELSDLASSINAMLGMLEQAQIERKQMSDVHLKRKLDSVAVLAGGLGHDFGNILMALSGNLALAKLTTDQTSETYQFLLGAEKASDRAKDIARQLRDFAKGGLPIKKPMSIVPLLHETVELFPHSSNTTCTLNVQEDVWHVEIDEGQMSQVLANMVINAQQAMPNGGAITIQVANVSEVVSGETVKWVQIAIQDQGEGIAPEHLDRIFDPYFTTKSDGNGLGLAMCYAIITKHGGNITVSSAPHQGARFTITLPAWVETTQPADAYDAAFT